MFLALSLNSIYLWVDSQTNEQIFVGFHVPSIPSQKLVDFVSVELQHIEVAHHQGSNKEFIIGEGVNVLIVVGEVLGGLQDLEQADRHQSTVECVLCPSVA